MSVITQHAEPWHGQRVVRMLHILVLAGCVTGNPGDREESTQHLTITVEGDGVGWVQVRGSGVDAVCTASCTVELADGPVQVYAGTPERLVGSSCGLENDKRHACDLDGGSLTVSFGKDPHEVLYAQPDGVPTALAFVADGELIVGSSTTIQRIALDGTTRWTVARATGTDLLASAGGLIITGPHVEAFRADGTMAWTSSFMATDVSASSAGIAIATPEGRVASLDPANGMQRWQSMPINARTVAIDTAGTVAAGLAPVTFPAGTMTTIARFDASGTALADISVPETAFDLAYDDTDHLVIGKKRIPPESIEPTQLVYLRVAETTMDTVAMESTVTHAGFALAGNTVFSWHHEPVGYSRFGFLGDGDLLVELRGATTTQVRKGYQASYMDLPQLIDVFVPAGAACDHAGHCALAGVYQGRVPRFESWLEVFSVP